MLVLMLLEEFAVLEDSLVELCWIMLCLRIILRALSVLPRETNFDNMVSNKFFLNIGIYNLFCIDHW